MQLSEHFSLEEMVASQTASRLGLDNTPPADVIENMKRAASHMEEVRALLGHSIVVSSGYRSPAVNQAVGGTETSAHCQGWAIDFICPGLGTPYQVAQKIYGAAVRFDQLIMEHTWVHISFDPRLRHQPLTLRHGGGYDPGIHE